MPIETDDIHSNVRTGVFICKCGGEISGKIDINLLQEKVAHLPGVVYSTTDSFPCNRGGRESIKQKIAQEHLERILIAGCTPRTVEKLFRQTGREAGLHSSSVQVADIREQCAYIHDEPDFLLQKALDLVAMGVSRLESAHTPDMVSSEIIQNVTIIGAGYEALVIAQSLLRAGKPVSWISTANEISSSLHPLKEMERIHA